MSVFNRCNGKKTFPIYKNVYVNKFSQLKQLVFLKYVIDKHKHKHEHLYVLVS